MCVCVCMFGWLVLDSSSRACNNTQVDVVWWWFGRGGNAKGANRISWCRGKHGRRTDLWFHLAEEETDPGRHCSLIIFGTHRTIESI